MDKLITELKRCREKGHKVEFKIENQTYRGRILRVSVYKDGKAFLVISTGKGMYTLSLKNLEDFKVIKA